MPARASHFVLACLLSLPTAGSAAAQQNALVTRRNTYWLGAGLGVGSKGFGGQINASYQFGANLVSFRTAGTAGLFERGFSDYALMYGRATRAAGERYLLAGAIGVAVVDGCHGSGLGRCPNVAAVGGLPLEVQAFWRPGRALGLGLYGFANINQAQSFAGLTLALQLGRLR